MVVTAKASRRGNSCFVKTKTGRGKHSCENNWQPLSGTIDSKAIERPANLYLLHVRSTAQTFPWDYFSFTCKCVFRQIYYLQNIFMFTVHGDVSQDHIKPKCYTFYSTLLYEHLFALMKILMQAEVQRSTCSS